MTVTAAGAATTPAGAAAILRTTTAVRERANQLLRRARAGDSRWFCVDDTALALASAAVADVTLTRYPNLEDPVPQPVATLRGRRGGPQRDTGFDSGDLRIRRRGPGSISRW